MKRTLLTAAFAAFALSAAQAVTVDWSWSNYEGKTLTQGDRWTVKDDAARTFTFTVADIAGVDSITITKLVAGINNQSGGPTNITGLTITDSEGNQVADVGAFTTGEGAIYTAAAGNNTTPTRQTADVNITLKTGETYTVAFDNGSAFSLFQTSDTVADATQLSGAWYAAFGLEGTYEMTDPMPEPTVLALLALGVAGVALRRRVA